VTTSGRRDISVKVALLVLILVVCQGSAAYAVDSGVAPNDTSGWRLGAAWDQRWITVEKDRWFAMGTVSVGLLFPYWNADVGFGYTFGTGPWRYTLGVHHNVYMQDEPIWSYTSPFLLVRYEGLEFEKVKIGPSFWVVRDSTSVRIRPAIFLSVPLW